MRNTRKRCVVVDSVYNQEEERSERDTYLQLHAHSFPASIMNAHACEMRPNYSDIVVIVKGTIGRQ